MLIEWPRSVAFRTYTNSFLCYDIFYDGGNSNELVIPKDFFLDCSYSSLFIHECLKYMMPQNLQNSRTF